MKSRTIALALSAALGIAWAGVGTTWAQDAMAVITKRQDAMKAQGKALGAIRDFTQDKGQLAAAQAAGAQLVQSIAAIPGMFAQKTGIAEFPGKTRAKSEIWAQWDKFNEATKAAGTQAEALNAALKSGDKAAITAALGVLAKDIGGANPNPGGCGGCHAQFRGPPLS